MCVARCVLLLLLVQHQIRQEIGIAQPQRHGATCIARLARDSLQKRGRVTNSDDLGIRANSATVAREHCCRASGASRLQRPRLVIPGRPTRKKAQYPSEILLADQSFVLLLQLAASAYGCKFTSYHLTEVWKGQIVSSLSSRLSRDLQLDEWSRLRT
jgi:hypothetical protein